MSNALIALHGFLGQATDWDMLDIQLLHAIDLYSLSWNSLWESTQALNTYVKSKTTHPILMGYSLGGRLALHALIQEPTLYKAAIIISAHPGLSDPSICAQRQINDEAWAKRFEEEGWHSLMSSWNQREVFAKDTFTFERHEADYDRAQLAAILRNGSLGQQSDLKIKIQKLMLPILWVVGENDCVYKSLASDLVFSHPSSQVVIIPNTGHRVPWTQPLLFKHAIHQFMQKVGYDSWFF